MSGRFRCCPHGNHVVEIRGQLVLGDALETENVTANYDAGVLTLRIPVTAQAAPRKIEIETKGGQHQIGA